MNVTIDYSRIHDDAVAETEQAISFMDRLPTDQEGPARALAVRSLIYEANHSAESLKLVCHIYALLADGTIVASSPHDRYMWVAGVSECLDLLPLVRRNIDQYLNRTATGEKDKLFGLFSYMKDLHELHLIARAKRRAECHGIED